MFVKAVALELESNMVSLLFGRVDWRLVKCIDLGAIPDSVQLQLNGDSKVVEICRVV